MDRAFLRRFAGRSIPAVYALLMLVGCSGGGESPTTPSPAPALDPQVPLPVLASQAVDHGMLPVGRYQVVVRGDRAEVTGARLAQAPIGQLFNVDVSDAFTHTFCNTCLETVGVRRNGEFLDLTMQVRHPFDLANDALPPSASNRRDLWINNVKGILLTDGDQSYFGGAVTLDPRTLGNPDGFTSLLMQPTGFQANAFPYKVFGAEGANLTRGNFDASVGWDLHRDDPTGFNVLANGQTGQATYRLRIQPGETLVFDLVLTASYSVSAANRTQRLTPTHFMPAGAPPEPWKVLAQAPGTLEAGNTASSVNLQLQALDWQHDPTLTVDPNFPDPSNRDGLAVSSRITAVSYSLPAITGEAETPVDLGEATGTGMAADPFTVYATVRNVNGVAEGTYLGVAKFVDERDPASTDAPYGTTTFIASDLMTPYTGITEFATYAVFQVVVEGTTGCADITEVRAGDSTNYEGRDPLYVWARSQTELLDALLMVEDPPGPVPVVDFSTQSVVVAVTGAFFDGAGQRTVEVASACPGPNGMAVTIRRGDPISGCPPNPGRSAPYAVAIVDDASLNVSFVEEQIDTCEPGGCVGVVWTSLLSDDAAEHYTGPPIATMVTNQTSYEAAAQPLVGNNPLPAIDFQTEVGIVISSGYSEVGFGARYTYVRDICHDEAADTLNVDWVAGEYETCPPPDLPPSAPFEIVAVDQRAAQAAFNAFTEDICGPPPPCDNAADYLLIAQADVQGVATAEAGAKVLSDQASFDAEWAKYFPEVDAPPVEFASRDVFIIAGPETSGSGTQRLVLESICFEPADNTLTVDYTRWNPMSPFCAKVDGIPSRPVLVLSTIRYESGPATVFTENLADICESPSCLGPPAELLASGDAAGTWTGGAQDLVIYDAATLRELWIATHSDGSNPPDVDFTTYAVAFSTSGHHDVGLGQYGIRHRDYCPFDISGAVNVRWLVPETCPQPEPVPTAPFVFSLLFNDSGGPGGRNAWYTFPKTTSDYCDPAANCFPAPWSFLDGGDYPDNTNALAYIEAFDNAADWQTAWNTFFSNPDTRPPLPDVDFTRSDALLYGIGFSPSGVGQRSTFPFDVCIDEQAMRLKVSASNGVPETCKPNDGGSHPWAAITVPKGSADLTLLTGFQTFDTCFENCFEYREVGTGLDALWMAPEPQYTLIADLDFRQRQQAYRDVWSQIGTGDPPGIDEMTEFDAVVVLIHGWRGSGRGSWQVELNRYCLAAGGLDIGVTRLGPYGGCNVIQVPTSPWAVYFAPLIDQTGTFDEIEVDTCP